MPAVEHYLEHPHLDPDLPPLRPRQVLVVGTVTPGMVERALAGMRAATDDDLLWFVIEARDILDRAAGYHARVLAAEAVLLERGVKLSMVTDPRTGELVVTP